MKDATMRPRRYLEAGLMVYLTPADRQRLREILKQEGIYSASSWFRTLAMQKINGASIVQGVEPSHEG